MAEGGGLDLEGALRKFLPVDNELFAGGLGLGAMGVGLSLLRKGSTAASLLARRHLLMTLEVTSKDVTYPWVLQWLNAHGRRTQHLSVRTAQERAIDGSSTLKLDLVPGPGKHLVHYGGRYFVVERQREHQTFSMSSGEPWEKVLLTSVGRDVSVFDRLLEEARGMNERTDDDATVVYAFWGSEWRPFGHPRRKRCLDSVVLDDGVKEGIVDDLHEWRASAPWYHARGIPYRRGYLLHGPPGSGKTSFIVALAGELGYSICILSLSDEHMTDDQLAQSLSTVPQQCIVLLEDIDAAFGSRAAGDGGGRRGAGPSLTFSGLLNVLDGVASSEDRLVFMTTNHLDRLDPALLRPGRVDVARELGAATESQARRLFAGFYGDRDSDNAQAVASLADDFAARVAEMDGAPSMAELQGHLMGHKGDPAGAVAHMAKLREATEERLSLVARQEAEARWRGATTAGIDGSINGSGGGERRRRGEGRRITATEVDKMMFNPQPGWEEQCGLK